jgi:hypothetical protein
MRVRGEEVNAQVRKDPLAKARVGRERKQAERGEMLHEGGLRLQHGGAELHAESQSPDSRDAMPVPILGDAVFDAHVTYSVQPETLHKFMQELNR